MASNQKQALVMKCFGFHTFVVFGRCRGLCQHRIQNVENPICDCVQNCKFDRSQTHRHEKYILFAPSPSGLWCSAMVPSSHKHDGGNIWLPPTSMPMLPTSDEHAENKNTVTTSEERERERDKVCVQALPTRGPRKVASQSRKFTLF